MLQSILSEIPELESMEINEKRHGVKMKVGEFLKTVANSEYYSYSGSLTTLGI